MRSTRKTKLQLLDELQTLREWVASLEAPRREEERVEETLRESEERFRALFEGSLDAIFLFDPESGRVVDANPAASELLSRPMGDIIGMHYTSLSPSQLRGRARRLFEERVEDREPARPIETVLIASDGTEKPVELLAQIIQVEGTPVLLGTFRDLTERKRVEEALRHSEERYRLLAENSPDVITIINPDNTFRYLSPAVERLLGYTPDEVIERMGFDHVHPDDRAAAVAAYADLLENPDELLSVRYRLRHRDGSWRFVEALGKNCLRNPAIRAVILNIRDITEQKSLEDALRSSEERYRLLVQNSSDIIALFNEDTSCSYVSPALERVLGHTPAEAMERIAFDDIHPEDREYAAAAFMECLNNPGVPVASQYRVRHKNGSWRFFETVGNNVIDNPDIRSIVINCRDITDRKRLEEELQKSEERYRLLAQKSADIIAIINPDNSFRYVSPAVKRILGYTPEEFIERMGFDHVHPEDREATVATFARCLTKPDSVVTAQYRLRHKDGSWRFVEALATNVLSNPAMRAVVLNLRDITERKQAEKALERAARLESLGVLCGGIAHDFNNILTAVLTNISMAQMYGDLEEDIEKMLADAEKASMRGKGLTQQLLTFARGGEPIKRPVSLPTLIRETIEFALSGSNVRCEHHLPKDLWPVEADEGQLGQVFQNIILNADQAMPGGGVIRVRAENLLVSEQDPLPLKPGHHVKVSIIDRGIGIPEEHLQKVFDPFYTTKQKGSGLGLSTSFSIVKRHDGALQIESRLGEGTQVHVYLPAVPEGHPARRRKTDESCRGTERILLVDDDNTLRRSIGKALRRLGYQVDEAEDGTKGVSVYQEALSSVRRVDAVIMDLTIPGGLGGRQAAQEILEMDPDAKLIVSSGYSTDPLMSDYRTHGFRAVIAKPYRIEELGKTLRGVLAGD